jgi:outer membrane protein assembly factor BamB
MVARWNRPALLGSALFVLAASARAGDWPQFRGPRGDGISEETQVPTTWSPRENIRWRTPLPAPGNSSPVVSRGRVFLTIATEKGKNRGLVCFDRATGKQLWERWVKFDGAEPTHDTNPYGSATPAADGERVVVWHSSAGLHGYDLDGEKLWARDLGSFVHIWGYAASPVIHGDAVILNCGPGERTFLAAFDKRTGQELWRADEPGGASGLVKKNPNDKREPWIGSWSTPVVATVDGADQILVSFPHHVQAYEPASGKILWRCGGLGDLVYTSVTVGNGIAVAMSGFHGPAMGLRLGGSGNVTSQNRLWHATVRNPQRIGSGVILGSQMYMANADSGTVQCFNVTTGKELWRDRLPGNAGCWGSIVVAGGRLYVTNQQGDTIVFRPNPQKLEVMAVNRLGEPSNSTPAVANGQIFLRTARALYCIAQGSGA